MTVTKIFPAIIVLLMAIAGIVCLIKGEVKNGAFWLLLAGANYCVAF